MIPKKIFQSHKSFDYVKSDPNLLNAVNSWKKYSPEYSHNFFTDQECDEFMQKNFKGIVYNCYKKLGMGVMKADLWRYCIIYHYGGIYADTDTVLLCNPNDIINNKNNLVIVPENNVHLCQWIFAAPPRNPILKSVIDLSVHRIQSEMDNVSVKKHVVHYLTGPGVFTDGIEKYLKKNNLETYNERNQYINYPHNIMHVYSHDLHEYMVKHLFTGSTKDDGWLYEKDTKFKV
jgi:mannosyltransferase OCH1-like enzyme